jgi:hypothetical protein
MKSSIALFGLVLLGASSLALADNPERHQHKPQAYTEDSVRTYADGSVAKRHVVQSVSHGGVSRQIVLTDAQGRTATRTVSMNFDRSKHAWSRSVQGTTFSGENYSASAQGQGRGGDFGGGHRHREGGEF